MNIQFLRATDKFQLTEDYVQSWPDYRGSVHTITYPKGLVFTLVNYTSHYQSTSVYFKTIINKKVIAECYGNMPKESYSSTYSWRPADKTAKSLQITGIKEMTEFFSKLQSFDEEYLRITGSYTIE